jgi:hypothetical protein
MGGGDEVEPVIDGLPVVFGEFDAAGVHLDEAAAGPDEVGEFGAVCGLAPSLIRPAYARSCGAAPKPGERAQALSYCVFLVGCLCSQLCVGEDVLIVEVGPEKPENGTRKRYLN